MRGINNLRNDILRGLILVQISIVQLIRSKRGLSIVALSLVPSILAPFAIRPSNSFQTERLFANASASLYIGLIIPLICLMLGATTVNAEIESRKIVQIMVRPVRKADLVLWKYVGVIISAFVISVLDSVALYFVYAGYDTISIELLYNVLYLNGICVLVYSSIFIFISFILKKPLLWGVFIILFDRIAGFLFFLPFGSMSINNHIINIGSGLNSLFLKLADISIFDSSMLLTFMTLVSLILSMIIFRFKDVL